MQYWDASALIPLVVRQPPFSEQCRRIFQGRAPRSTAFVSRVECRSAIERLAREGALDPTSRRRCVARVDRLFAGFDLVAFSADVEREALALLSRHPLRSMDALQLACALTLGPGGVDTVQLVCCDHRLAAAGAAERLTLAIQH
jgi:predicted nucleic acid-binding protein